MTTDLPRLAHGAVVVRGIHPRDARALEQELAINRRWLERWEATLPGTGRAAFWDGKASIRSLLAGAKDGTTMPMAIEVDGEFAGQLTVSAISWGALANAQIGYWVSERHAGRNVTPTAVALIADHLFFQRGLHRIEICIRPENLASLRVPEKLGWRFEGLRRRYIHIDGDWRDHLCFALVREELPEGILERWLAGRVPPFDRGQYPVPVGDHPRAE